ncbi:2-oxo acid dehydrogenase subunit E2 [Streptomyces incanus]|uniref:2-oxo acid dehydrogenase subunit E2 n=1 Tax=Streptomyces incanus TaxID=887453 RepID=A0ABW0XZ05_9ACTN
MNQTPDGLQVVSCASCTTNCITPVVEVLDHRIGIERAIMSTVHAYTSTQQLVDGPSRDVRRGRAAGVNMVPASTGAAQAAPRAPPALAGRFDGVAIRVPVPVGPIPDIVAVTTRSTTAEEVNDIFRQEADTDRHRDVLAVSEQPLVSTDIIGDPRASVIDAAMTRVVDGTLVKIMSWYDNEWASPTRWSAKPCPSWASASPREHLHHPTWRGAAPHSRREDEPVVRDGELTVDTVMALTLSIDHRALDGPIGAVFLTDLKALLEQPMHIVVQEDGGDLALQPDQAAQLPLGSTHSNSARSPDRRDAPARDPDPNKRRQHHE